MSDENAPDAIAKEESKRYWRETEKQKLIIAREWAYLAIAVLVAAMLVWALWSWRNVNNNTSEKWSKLDAVLNEVHETVKKVNDQIDSNGGAVNGVLIEAKARLAALAPLEANLAATAGTANREIAATAATARAQLASIGPAVDQVRTLTARLDMSLSGDPAEALRTGKPSGLLPTAAEALDKIGALAAKLGVTADDLDLAIKQAADKTGKSIDDIRALLARPEILSIMQHADKTMGHVEEISGSAAKAMEKAPSIAASLDKIATTSSRFTKITLITNIIGTLAKAFLP